jgi:6-phospho-3-hexuloisomerase
MEKNFEEIISEMKLFKDTLDESQRKLLDKKLLDIINEGKFKSKIDAILLEIRAVLKSINEEQVEKLAQEILKTKKIVVCGAGRVGMAIRGFGMRLGHLGLNAYTLGDSVVSSIGKGDLFLVASGSGETQTIYDLVCIANKNNAKVALITGNPESRMGKIADIIVKITAPSKTKPVENFSSIQPMTTLNEQCLGIFFDAVVLDLMEKMEETHDTMWARHSNLE